METKMRNQGEVTIISIQGSLSIEQTQGFREACIKHLRAQKVIFNMEKVNFVGSTGIQPFLEAVKSLTESSDFGLKIAAPKAEFRRILQNLEFAKLEIHDSEEGALASFVSSKYTPPTIIG